MSATVIEMPAIEKNVNITAEYSQAMAVATAEQYTEACEFLKSIAKTRKEVEGTFGPIKSKQYDAWKEAVAQEKKFLDPLDKATLLIKGKISGYLAEQERTRRIEEERQREIARQESDARAVAEATELERQGDTQAAEQIIHEAVTAPAPVVIVPKTVAKQEGIAPRKVWKFRIVDSAKIPREYLSVDEQKIGQIVRAMKEMAKIPGVEVYSEDTVSVRG